MVADDLDNCEQSPNPSQIDSDDDGIGDACDPDIVPGDTGPQDSGDTSPGEQDNQDNQNNQDNAGRPGSEDPAPTSPADGGFLIGWGPCSTLPTGGRLALLLAAVFGITRRDSSPVPPRKRPSSSGIPESPRSLRG